MREAKGKWSHDSLSVTALTEKVEECSLFPRPLPSTSELLDMAALVIDLRQAILTVGMRKHVGAQGRKWEHKEARGSTWDF